MLTRDDLIDLLVAGLAKAGPATAVSPAPKGPPGRPFLSEHDIKKRLTPTGKRLTIPKNSIVSPLAFEFLILQGIEIVRE
ncbi:MAG: hypothetical protein KGJ84_02360 [Elusimicrobia bacterium]|nr:hypothetical protein [Elusimicrobiota bacterium]